jgi:hypothetical protein
MNRGRQEAMPPLPVCNKRLEILNDLGVVHIAADEPRGTQPDAAYSAGTRSLI